MSDELADKLESEMTKPLNKTESLGVDLFGNPVEDETLPERIKTARLKGKRVYKDPITGNWHTTPRPNGYAGTHGPGTDIRATAPACQFFEKNKP